MGNKKYNWKDIFKEFMDGNYINIKEFIEYCEAQGNGYPTGSSIYKQSAKNQWDAKKNEKYSKAVDDYVTQAITRAEKKDIENILQLNRRLTIKQVELVEAIINRVKSGNMDGFRININYSDAVNDLKRSIEAKTKEQEQAGATVNIQNNSVEGAVSFRRRVEDMSHEELSRFSKKIDAEKVEVIDVNGEVIEELEFEDDSEGEE